MSFIPKNRSGDYRPWQLKSLQGSGNQQAREQQDAERVKAINQEAYRQGYEAGHAQGAARAAAEARRLAQLVDGARQEIAGLEQRIAEDLVRLALTLARTMVREALAVQPQLVAAIVRESVADVPPFAQGMRLRLNPEDAALLRAQLTQELGESWTLIEDASLARGGCRVETPAAEVDATLETRWQKLAAALAQDHAWLS